MGEWIGHGVVWTQSELRAANYPKRHGNEAIRWLHNSSKHGLESTLSTPGAAHLSVD